MHSTVVQSGLQQVVWNCRVLVENPHLRSMYVPIFLNALSLPMYLVLDFFYHVLFHNSYPLLHQLLVYLTNFHSFFHTKGKVLDHFVEDNSGSKLVHFLQRRNMASLDRSVRRYGEQ